MTATDMRDELQSMADALKARNEAMRKPQPLREFVGPFPIKFALPERMPVPYVLVKREEAA